MRRVAAGRAAAADGFVTVQFIAAVAFSLVLLVMLANLIVYQYGRGVVRAAVDEAARAGSRRGATVAECESAGRRAVSDLLGGPLGDEVVLSCVDGGAAITARAQAVFRGWLPAVPDWTFTVESAAIRAARP